MHQLLPVFGLQTACSFNLCISCCCFIYQAFGWVSHKKQQSSHSSVTSPVIQATAFWLQSIIASLWAHHRWGPSCVLPWTPWPDAWLPPYLQQYLVVKTYCVNLSPSRHPCRWCMSSGQVWQDSHCFCALLDDMSPPLFCLHPPPTHLTPTASQRLVSTTLLVTTDNSIQNFSSPSIRRGREGGITTVKLMLKTILCLTCMVVIFNVTHTIKWTFFSSTTQTDTKPTVQ